MATCVEKGVATCVKGGVAMCVEVFALRSIIHKNEISNWLLDSNDTTLRKAS